MTINLLIWLFGFLVPASPVSTCSPSPNGSGTQGNNSCYTSPSSWPTVFPPWASWTPSGRSNSPQVTYCCCLTSCWCMPKFAERFRWYCRGYLGCRLPALKMSCALGPLTCDGLWTCWTQGFYLGLAWRENWGWGWGYKGVSCWWVRRLFRQIDAWRIWWDVSFVISDLYLCFLPLLSSFWTCWYYVCPAFSWWLCCQSSNLIAPGEPRVCSLAHKKQPALLLLSYAIVYNDNRL